MALTVRRPARRHDADGIAEVHMTARQEAIPYLPELHTDDETPAWVAQLVLQTKTVRVVESGHRMVGISAPDGDKLEQIHVLPGEQGKGVGSRLLAKATKVSPAGLCLWTFQRTTPARAFYERCGFTAFEFGDCSGDEEGKPDVLSRWIPASPDRG